MSCRKYSHFSTAGIDTLKPAWKSPQKKRGAGWHLLNCQVATGQVLHRLKSLNAYPPSIAPTFIFFQYILISLEVFLLVREHISLRRVLSHNPGFTNWTFTSDGQGHSTRVCTCVCVRLCSCVCAEESGVSGAVVVWKETPYIPPLSVSWPIGGTSSQDW